MADRLLGPVMERYISSVVKSLTQAPSECAPWPGQKDRLGYGRATVGYTTRAAHRVVYERLRGEVPEGLELDHLCRNKGCVNPAHLEPVTGSQNRRRIFGTDTVCRRGHERNEKNGYILRGCYFCRPCNALAAAAYKRRKAAL